MQPFKAFRCVIIRRQYETLKREEFIMKKYSYIKVLGLLLLLVFILTSCSSKKSDNGSSSNSESMDFSDQYQVESKAFNDELGIVEEESFEKPAMDSQKYGSDNTSTSEVSSTFSDMNRKLIRKIFYQLETQEFDTVMKTINSRINQLGGYAEQSTTSGDHYYNGINTRISDIVARIPKDKVNEFVGIVEGLANIISKDETAEDVTLQYVDIESHKKSLLIEQERVMYILEKTETLKDIIALESRLSELRYKIESYETNLRTLDNLIDYSTVTLKIYEVERITTPKVVTTADRMRTGLSDNMYVLKNSFVNFVVGLVVNIPYIIIWSIIIVIAFAIYRILRKSKKVTKILGELKRENTTDKKEDEKL